jgi:hypothetical protein
MSGEKQASFLGWKRSHIKLNPALIEKYLQKRREYGSIIID